jgi:SAM-dependent methyltransferase
MQIETVTGKSMGDLRQFKIVRKYFSTVQGAVLEVGSRDYGNTPDFRSIFVNNEYVGVDIEAGKGVDCRVDLTSDIASLTVGHFDLVICCSVMEHTPRPWIMADNICRLMKPGASIYVSVPWIFPFHGYPNDYFRFSPAAIKALFPDVRWHTQLAYSGPKGKFVPIADAGFDDFCKVAAQDTETGSKVAAWRKCIINLLGTFEPVGLNQLP